MCYSSVTWITWKRIHIPTNNILIASLTKMVTWFAYQPLRIVLSKRKKKIIDFLTTYLFLQNVDVQKSVRFFCYWQQNEQPRNCLDHIWFDGAFCWKNRVMSIASTNVPSKSIKWFLFHFEIITHEPNWTHRVKWTLLLMLLTSASNTM